MFQRNVWASIMALCVCSLALCSSQASAQENTVLKQYYGNGVHAFYSGNFAEAFDLLSKPIDAKIEDPRPYYFRGFALMELGRPEQAEKDFKAGAELELKDTTGRFPVNFALERCQGKSRIALEKARNEVQLAAFQRRAKYNNAIYNNRIEDQKATLIPDNIDLPGGSTLDIEDGDSLINDNDVDNGNPLLDEDDSNADKPADANDVFEDDNKTADPLFDDEDDNAADKPADDDNAEKANDSLFDDEDDNATPAADDNAANDDVFGDNALDADDDNTADADAADNDAADKPADNGIFGDEEEDNKADDAGDTGDADDAADDKAEADPFTQETPEETADANPFKDANLDDEDADAADKADDADNADAADNADDAADKADDADAADDNAGKDDPFSDFEF